MVTSIIDERERERMKDRENEGVRNAGKIAGIQNSWKQDF